MHTDQLKLFLGTTPTSWLNVTNRVLNIQKMGAFEAPGSSVHARGPTRPLSKERKSFIGGIDCDLQTAGGLADHGQVRTQGEAGCGPSHQVSARLGLHASADS